MSISKNGYVCLGSNCECFLIFTDIPTPNDILVGLAYDLSISGIGAQIYY